jgi:hypothetical protein
MKRREEMVDISKELVEVVNKPGRIGILGTADNQGQPNAAYFGSPRLMDDGTLVMGLSDNRTLKNLQENPLAVFFSITESPVTFTTPGFRLYLKVHDIQKEGPILDAVKEKIAEHAGPDAAKMIVAGVAFEITEVRALVDMG